MIRTRPRVAYLCVSVLLDVLFRTRKDDAPLLLVLLCTQSGARSCSMTSHHAALRKPSFSPERWLTFRQHRRTSSRVCGGYHHRMTCAALATKSSRDIPRFSLVAMARSSRARSCDFRFLRRFSGTNWGFSVVPCLVKVSTAVSPHSKRKHHAAYSVDDMLPVCVLQQPCTVDSSNFHVAGACGP